MNMHTKISVMVAASILGIFGIASNALAGEGGAAGAASFNLTTGTIDAGQVQGVSVAASVGKNNAFASAKNMPGVNTAYALGSAGVITVSEFITSYYDPNTGRYVPAPMVNAVGNLDSMPGTAQVNELDSPQTINIGSQFDNSVVYFGNHYLD